MKQNTIQSFNYRDVTHQQLRTLIERIIALWSGRENTPLKIRLAIAELEKLLPIHLKLLTLERESEAIELAHRTDVDRDRATNLFIKKVRVAREEWDQNIAEAAEVLYEAIKRNGFGIDRLPYAEQTAKTKELQEIFAPLAMQAHLATVNVAEDFTRVIDLNNSFETNWEGRIIDDTKQEKLPRMTTVRKQMNSELRHILSDMEYLRQKNHNSVDETMFEAAQQLVQEVVTVIRKRESQEQSA